MVTARRPLVALITSHPLSPPWDSADKQVAALVARNLLDYRFVSARRAGTRGPEIPGARVPVLSRHGRPSTVGAVQIGALTLTLSAVVELRHVVVTIGAGYPRLARLLGRLPSALTPPTLHTAPGVVDPRLWAQPGHDLTPLGTTVVLSETSARVLRDAGFPDVRVVPPCIPLARWPRTMPFSGDPLVLFAGHHDEGGGAETIIDAFAASSSRHTARLVLAMRTRPGQPETALNERLRARAASRGLHRVEVRGHVDDMPQLIRSAALVAFPARTLAGKADVPLVLLEAMATGRPVVVSDLPSLDVLAPAVSRARPEPWEFARAMDEALASPRLWAEQARNGRRLVEDNFSEQALIRSYAELYGELADTREPWTSRWKRR